MSDQFQFETRGRMTAHEHEHGHESRLSQECFNPLDAHCRPASMGANGNFNLDFSGNITAIDFQHGGLYQSHVEAHEHGRARVETHQHGKETTVTISGGAEMEANFNTHFPLQQPQCWPSVYPTDCQPTPCETAPQSKSYPPAYQPEVPPGYPSQPQPACPQAPTYYGPAQPQYAPNGYPYNTPVPGANGGVQVQYQGEQYPTWYPSSQFQTPPE